MDGNAGHGTGEQTGMTGTSSVTVFFYFPLSFFSHLLSLLSQTTATDGAGLSGTGQNGPKRAATGRDGGQAGGRRREEKGGRRARGEHGDS